MHIERLTEQLTGLQTMLLAWRLELITLPKLPMEWRTCYMQIGLGKLPHAQLDWTCHFHFQGFALPLYRKKKAFLFELHAGICGPHQGTDKMYSQLLVIGYYWPTMMNDAREFVRKCDVCQRPGNLIHRPSVDLHSRNTPWPFHTWAMDIIGPIAPSEGREWILAATEHFTKWVEAVALRNIRAENIDRFIKDNLRCRFGIPKRIISDNW